MLDALRDVKYAMKIDSVAKETYLAFHEAAQALHAKRKNPTDGFSPDPKDETDGKRRRLAPFFPEQSDDADHMEIDTELDPTTLEDLPNEIITLIIKRLRLDYVMDLRNVNSRFRDIVDGAVLPGITRLYITIDRRVTRYLDAALAWLNDPRLPVRLEEFGTHPTVWEQKRLKSLTSETDYGSWRWLSENEYCELISLVLHRASPTLRVLSLDFAGIGIWQLRALGRCHKVTDLYIGPLLQISDVPELRRALLKLPLTQLFLPPTLTRIIYPSLSDDMSDYRRTFMRDDVGEHGNNRTEVTILTTDDFWLTQTYGEEIPGIFPVRFPLLKKFKLYPNTNATDESTGVSWFHKLASMFPVAEKILLLRGPAANAYPTANAPIVLPASCDKLIIPSVILNLPLSPENKQTVRSLTVDSLVHESEEYYDVSHPSIEKVAGVFVECEELHVSTLVPPPQASVGEWIQSLTPPILRFLDGIRTFSQGVYVNPSTLAVNGNHNYEWSVGSLMPSVFAHHVPQAMKNLTSLTITFPPQTGRNTRYRFRALELDEYAKTLRLSVNLRVLTIINHPYDLLQMYLANRGRRLDVILLRMDEYPEYGHAFSFKLPPMKEMEIPLAVLGALDPQSTINGKKISAFLEEKS